MDTPSPQPSPVASPKYGRWLLAWLLLTVYFLAPPRAAFDQSLDKSNYATYTHFVAHGFQWGTEVLPMTGPFGFILYGHTYTGELFGVRLVADLLLKAVFSLLLLRLFFRAGPGAIRWIWLTGVVLMVPTVDDLFHDFAILVATLVLLVELGPRINRWSQLAAVLLGALALFKGTHLLTTALCFSSVLLLCAFERRWRQLGLLAAIYAGAILGFWILAGQHPLHLPAYLRAVLELSSGYNASMGLDALPFLTGAGFALAGGLALVFLWMLLAGGRQLRPLLALLLLAGFSFIKWKHGYLRADGHVYIFFTSVSVITLTLCLTGLTPLLGSVPPAIPAWSRRAGLSLITLVTGFAVLGAAEFWLWRVFRIGVDAPILLAHNAGFLIRPGHYRAQLDEQLEFNRREAHVPQIQNEIGREPVDFFGYEEGLLLLNGFNYRPRPMGGGSFNVFTSWLQEQNEKYVRDPFRAPPWQVLKFQTLDDRLPAADDPLTLRAILELYSPVLMQRDYVLFRHRTHPPSPGAPQLLETRRIPAGETVTVPATGKDRMLLFTVDAPLSTAGKIRSFFYRPPELQIKVTTVRYPRGRTFVLKPGLLRQPVVLSPLLVDNTDVLQLYGDGPGDRVTSFALLPAPGFVGDALAATFFSAPRPLAPENGDLTELLTYHEYPLYNRSPIELVTAETGIKELNKEPITIVHAPGSITWDLKPDDQQVIFSYGLMPQSYLDGGKTDGVEFNVEVLWPPKDGRVLFKRMMRPLTVATDRGMQRARIFLPPYEPGARLRIRTHPGPDNDGGYDQSYVTRLQIKSGPLAPEQFNGLGVVPADRALPHGAVAGVGDRPVYLIHAPEQVELNAPGEAHEMSCQIGLLPGAYQNGGNTDGVGFTIESVRPDGQRAVLLKRYLDPVHVPADRGPQALTVPLPVLPNGSKIVVRTDIGPNGDRGWDQSYIAQVIFR